MKLSSSTIEVLKNFSTINQSIIFKPGYVQRTISPHKNIFAEATLKEEFPVECAIYELPKFLAVLTLFDTPDLKFGEQYVDIVSSNSSNHIKYFYANPSLIVAPPPTALEIEEEVDKFRLDQETLGKLNKASLIMGNPDFVIERNGKVRTIKTTNIKNKSANVFTVTQDVSKGASYSVTLNSENLKYIPNDYEFIVGKIKGTSIVTLSSDTVKYWIATEA